MFIPGDDADGTALHVAYPNPFGRVITVLPIDLSSAGTHHLQQNADDLPNGLSPVRIEAEDYGQVRKIPLLK